jgi:ERCC4-type nuclease
MYFIDNREIDLVNILKTESANIKQLPVGDIWIGIDEVKEEEKNIGGIVIERKSVKDLEASILDGRYREQRGRILAFCEQNNSQAVYIIEGNLNSSTGRLKKSAIMKFINRLILHYQIPIIQTSSLIETSELVKCLIDQWEEDPKKIQRTTTMIKITDGIHIKKKDNSCDRKKFLISCLAQCPGVSVKMAEVLVDTFNSLEGIMKISVKEMENIKVGTRKIGPVVSKRLYDLLHNE